MRKKLKKFKPGVDRRTHIFLAAAIWPLVGLMLSYRGLSRLVGSGYEWFIALSFIIGSLKSIFVLDKSARKGIKRILQFGDNTCIGAVYSVKTWLMVLVMIASGFVLRNSSLPAHYLGLLYVAIGWGLLLSSRHAWFTWFHLIGKDQASETGPSREKKNG